MTCNMKNHTCNINVLCQLFFMHYFDREFLGSKRLACVIGVSMHDMQHETYHMQHKCTFPHFGHALLCPCLPYLAEFPLKKYYFAKISTGYVKYS